MQLNNPKNSTSNLIKQSESAKKQARRRLIGSIFLLFTALIILLNVTAKVKPIPVSPKVIEISSNASAPAKTISSEPNLQASAPVALAASSPISSSQAKAVATSTNNIVANASEPHSNGFKAGVLNRGEQNNSTEQNQAQSSVSATPKVISMSIGGKPSPEDILNGNASTTQSTVYFVQIAASQNKAALTQLQHSLAQKGIKSFIPNSKNNMYRLRVGPFKSKDEANQTVATIQGN